MMRRDRRTMGPHRAWRSLRAAAAAGAPVIGCGVGLCVAAAQTPSDSAPNAGGEPRCAVSGSENVFVEGGSMLRLGDVAGCPDLRYEVVPGVLINGQPAVRILPKEACVPGGANSVTISGRQAQRTGDGC